MKKKKLKVRSKSARVRKADSGGYIVHHDDQLPDEAGQMPAEQQHVVPDLDALKEHLGQSLTAPGEAQ